MCALAVVTGQIHACLFILNWFTMYVMACLLFKRSLEDSVIFILFTLNEIECVIWRFIVFIQSRDMFATVSLSGYIIAIVCLGFLCLLPSVQFNALKRLSITALSHCPDFLPSLLYFR